MVIERKINKYSEGIIGLCVLTAEGPILGGAIMQ